MQVVCPNWRYGVKVEKSGRTGWHGSIKGGQKSICLPVPSVAAYETLVSNPAAFRRYLELWVAKQPKIFPPDMRAGFRFHDFVTGAEIEKRRCVKFSWSRLCKWVV